ncbi:hypothetical protein CTI14_65095, partial [Methylobacterium radiotolerans]
VQQLLGEFTDSDAIPAIAVFTSEEELTPSELEAISDAVADAPDVEGVADDVSPALPSSSSSASSRTATRSRRSRCSPRRRS